MLEQFTTLLNQYANAFHEQIPRYRQNRYVQIVVLRETKSHAIFTTEGETLDVERLQAGITTRRQIDRVVMYKRKQIAPERRTGKALLRDLGILQRAGEGKKEKGKGVKQAECQIMGASCGQCPDCILYGYAATKDAGSQRARVLTDSGFVVRDIPQVMRNIKLNAIQDTVAGGIAGSAFASRENVLPQIFIPTAETLLDVTAPEFAYVLGNILKTTRYGAESNREGFIRNHILGVYFSDTELFSNLELTQRYYDVIAEKEGGTLPDYLSVDQFLDTWSQVEQATLSQVFGRKRKVEDLGGMLAGVQALYEDEASLRNMLQKLDEDALRYVKDVKSKDKDAADEAGENDTEA
ncbi:MAG TPA: type I-D CRISPR-associated protein Cas7/Csc2 [Ktedonobacteraceae bacterium]|nr:type I-D CRISPR-associated protein Cas7/Csc2 [Ktedonobacteraceae bacterium]